MHNKIRKVVLSKTDLKKILNHTQISPLINRTISQAYPRLVTTRLSPVFVMQTNNGTESHVSNRLENDVWTSHALHCRRFMSNTLRFLFPNGLESWSVLNCRLIGKGGKLHASLWWIMGTESYGTFVGTFGGVMGNKIMGFRRFL